MPTDTKTCNTCGETKPATLEFFVKRSDAKSGLAGHCILCNRERNRKWKAENPERSREITSKANLKWRTANPEKSRESSRKWVAANPEKSRDKNRKWRAENPDKVSENNRKWREENPDKNREYSNKRRARKACAVPQRWCKSECPEHLCYWCGIDLATTETHLEHLMPISLGGEAKPYNEAPACKDCNLSKHDKHPLVWIASMFD